VIKISRLETERLILRQFSFDDAPMIQKLVGAREIADTTLEIPHPYEDGMAEEWLNLQKENFVKGVEVSCAITLKENGNLAGGINLRINKRFNRAEMGYWIAVPYWNKGYCTEAARKMLEYGFKELKLNRIFAHHMVRNASSGRVMEKIGMKYEGTLRQHVIRWDKYEDLKIYSILSSEFDTFIE
jgi:RimJ/RimL family protein N-acetyltransferase